MTFGRRNACCLMPVVGIDHYAGGNILLPSLIYDTELHAAFVGPVCQMLAVKDKLQSGYFHDLGKTFYYLGKTWVKQK